MGRSPILEDPIGFGPLLRQYRIAAGLTQEALAERTGLGVRSIQHLEGGAHLPHRETVGRLIKGLGITGEDRSVFERSAQPSPRQREAHSLPVGEARVEEPEPRDNLPAQLTTFVGRVDELAEKCNEGQLTSEERNEYEAYVQASTLIGILQAKARRILRQAGTS
jgi:transcriptional regulator with XRE-family HTH domain